MNSGPGNVGGRAVPRDDANISGRKESELNGTRTALAGAEGLDQDVKQIALETSPAPVEPPIPEAPASEGLLVDVNTGEVVPRMGIVCVSSNRGSPERPRTLTGADSTFRFDGEWPIADGSANEPIVFELRDGPQMRPNPSKRVSVERPPSDPIEVSVGPTFRFGPQTTNRLGMAYNARARALGVEPVPIELDFVELGAVGFKLIRVGGEDFLQDPQVEVVADADGRVHRVELSELDLQWVGSLTGLAPGHYSWRLLFAGDERSGELDVNADEWTRVGIEAATLAGDGFELAIDTSRATDADLSDWTLHLIDVDQDTRHTSLEPERSRTSPETLWLASLGALPEGAWLGSLRPGDGYRVTPPIIEVGPGRPDARVVVEPYATRTIELDVTDKDSGRPIESAIAMLIDGMHLERLERAPQGHHETAAAPVDRDVTIQVRAPGFEMADLRIAGGAQEIQRDVQLRRGWRNCVRVFDGRSAEPVRGISVHVDGEFSGTTDADGSLWL